MKLPIEKKYFDQIKSGKKGFDYRDGHITFVCTETGEELTKEVTSCHLIHRKFLPYSLKRRKDILKGDYIIEFGMKKH